MTFLTVDREIQNMSYASLDSSEILNIPFDFVPVMKLIGATMHGSREMASRPEASNHLKFGLKENTDFDFVAQNIPDVQRILYECGFKRIDDNYFKNSNQLFVACYTKTYNDSYVPAKVQVILLSDHKTYQSVWESIDPDFYEKYIWKSGPNKPNRKQISAIIDQLITTFLSF